MVATAVLVVVGGPQVRAGSHRHFVQLARHLATHGHAVMRFDVRGMGDVRSVTYEYGNAFLIVAGLLNLLVVIDAFDVAGP